MASTKLAARVNFMKEMNGKSWGTNERTPKELLYACRPLYTRRLGSVNSPLLRVPSRVCKLRVLIKWYDAKAQSLAKRQAPWRVQSLPKQPLP